MSDQSAIEWTDATWNPVRGCTKVSAGCKHCYAETFAERWRGVPGHPFEQGFDVRLVPEALGLPVRWRRKPRRIFVNSMSDLFHEAVPFDFIDRVFGVMAGCEFLGYEGGTGHTFQVLTKRAARMREYLSTDRRRAWAQSAVNYGGGEDPDPLFDQIDSGPRALPHVWLGVSVEDQAAADERIPELLATPAAFRFLSCEPLLGPVDIVSRLLQRDLPKVGTGPLDYRNVPAIGWVIAGGESGPRARPMHPAWARSLRDQCQAVGVPFFFKQWGEWRAFYSCSDDPDARALPPVEEPRRRWLNLSGGHGFHGEAVVAIERLGKKAAGRELDGRTWDEMPRSTT